jgi:hypothetical protein
MLTDKWTLDAGEIGVRSVVGNSLKESRALSLMLMASASISWEKHPVLLP